MKETIHKDRYDTFLSKPQHGSLFRQMIEKDYDVKTCLSWIEKCHLSPQSEAYIFGLQEMAIFTRWHERHILKIRESDLCRICKKESETTLLVVTPSPRRNTLIDTIVLLDMFTIKYATNMVSKLNQNGIFTDQLRSTWMGKSN